MMQYVAIRYAPGDRRSYTFANDGEPVKAGDFVEAPLRNGDPKVVEVVSVEETPPPFDCKRIIGKAERPASWPVPEAEIRNACFVEHDVFQQDCLACAKMN